MTTLTLSCITTLTKMIPDIAQLKLAIDFKARCYAEISMRASDAWRWHNEAINNNEPYSVRNDFATTAEYAQLRADEAWGEWQDAKAVLLARWC